MGIDRKGFKGISSVRKHEKEVKHVSHESRIEISCKENRLAKSKIIHQRSIHQR